MAITAAVGNTFSVRLPRVTRHQQQRKLSSCRLARERISVGADYSNNVGDNLQKNRERPLGIIIGDAISSTA
jgi:hypothetical protein